MATPKRYPLAFKMSLVDKVKDHRELWDPTCEIKNKIIVQNIWIRVATQLKMPADKVKTQWKSLLKSHTEHLSGTKQMPDELVDRMDFLRNYSVAPKKVPPKPKTPKAKNTPVPSTSNSQPGNSDFDVCSLIATHIFQRAVAANKLTDVKKLMVNMLFHIQPEVKQRVARYVKAHPHLVSKASVKSRDWEPLNMPGEVGHAILCEMMDDHINYGNIQ